MHYSAVIIPLTLISLFGYIFGLFSLFLRQKLYLNEVLLSTVFGLFSNKIIEHYINDTFIYELARVVICLQVMAVGIIVPHEYMWREKRSLFIILLPVMFLSYIISAVIIKYILQMQWLHSFLIAACITPTDPVLATSCLKGKFATKYIPAHLRNLLIAESGANDGLGYILFTLPLLFGELSTRKFLQDAVIMGFIAAIFIGASIGYVAKKIFIFCKRGNMIDKESNLVMMIMLGLFVTGVTSIIGSSDILSCFVCGLVFSQDAEYKNEIHESSLLEVLDLLLNHAFFICFGAILPISKFSLRHLILSILILMFRRMPFFVLFYKLIPQLKNKRELFFAGWFGPIGVGAVFFALHAKTTNLNVFSDSEEDIMVVIYSMVAFSIVVYGLTAPIMNLHLRRRKEVHESESTYYENIAVQ